MFWKVTFSNETPDQYFKGTERTYYLFVAAFIIHSKHNDIVWYKAEVGGIELNISKIDEQEYLRVENAQKEWLDQYKDCDEEDLEYIDECWEREGLTYASDTTFYGDFTHIELMHNTIVFCYDGCKVHNT